ncbi:hypothetical protein GO755_03765 [Spirosoma sp. HMF4905]|uniref:DUF4595 domain-containing protein n=1 Tax=Spirosoma arboris TaxID=2682092 RepID=A0A7K1S5N8_9BACT|nr:hypothetical protein [Spirosoma arboris]MVM29137.1 hypothetical protein [Spirosoma arboris]
MKQSVKIIPFFLCFSALTGLMACERETAESLVQPEAEQQTVSLAGGIVVNTTKYLLTKHGTTVLSYDTDGRLKKVTLSPTHYIDYTYQDGEYKRVFTKEYNDNKLDVATTYYIHRAQAANSSGYIPVPPKGSYYENYPDQCYYVETERYMHYPLGDKTIKTNCLYTYNDKGQIAKVYLGNWPEPDNFIDFAYNTNGDLLKATEYTPQKVKIRESTFEYTAFGDPIRNDRTVFNPEELQVDPYATVFGKYSNHLARAKKIEAFAPYSLESNYYYQYLINSDGYVTKRDTYTISNAQLIQSTPYEYLVTSPRNTQ